MIKNVVISFCLILFFNSLHAQISNGRNIFIYADTMYIDNDTVYSKTYIVGNEIKINEGYYSNGNRAFINSEIYGKHNGTSLFWFRNGNLKYLSNYLAGVENGIFYEWYSNGNIKRTTDYGYNKSDIFIEKTCDTIRIITDSLLNLTTDSINCYNKLLNGKICQYYENGNIMRVEEYNQGRKNGTFYFYDINGVLIRELKFKNDKEVY